MSTGHYPSVLVCSREGLGFPNILFQFCGDPHRADTAVASKDTLVRTVKGWKSGQCPYYKQKDNGNVNGPLFSKWENYPLDKSLRKTVKGDQQ